MDLENFIKDLSSKSPAPGGGSASALFGVLGSALASMVCALTEGRTAYAKHQFFVTETHNKILELQKQLTIMMDKDVEAFLQISDAYKLPRDTEENKIKRSEAIQSALLPATKVPLEIIKLAAEGLDLTNSLIGKTNKQASSDIGCAALGFKAALQGAYLNVKINLKASKTPMPEIKSTSYELYKEYCSIADEIYTKVLETL